jgi:PAS domain S-box-containing protein/putative nucleotidyltransferase with HDIG domain
MDDGYFEVDLAGNFTFVNDADCFLLGSSREELIGTSFRNHINKEDVETVYSAFAKIYSTGKPERGIYYRGIRKDGTTRFAEISGFPMKNDKGEIIGFRGMALDITARRQMEEELRQSEEKYRTILENMQDAYFEVDDAGNFTFFNDAMCHHFGYSREELMGMNYRQYTDHDNAKKLFQAYHKVYTSGEPIKEHFWQITRKDGTKRYLAGSVSLKKDSQGEPTGFKGIDHDITDRKQTEDKLLLTLESLRKAVGTTIQVLVSALEARDPYTAGHQSRVADLARAIATEMGLDQEKIEGIRMAGSIHDIGKLSIPAEILSKPTKLTNLEFSLIKEHAQSGYEMLKDVESPWPLAQIVYQHHERMNGSGYPQKLKGDEILIEARIMGVADVVEAMASHRPYRAGLGIDAALDEIKKNKGILYDPAVADACLKLFLEKGYQLPLQIN